MYSRIEHDPVESRKRAKTIRKENMANDIKFDYYSPVPMVIDKVFLLTLDEYVKLKTPPAMCYVVNELPATETAHLALKNYLFSFNTVCSAEDMQKARDEFFVHYDDCYACGFEHEHVKRLEEKFPHTNFVSYVYGGIQKDELYTRRQNVIVPGFVGTVATLAAVIDCLCFYVYANAMGFDDSEYEHYIGKMLSSNRNRLSVSMNDAIGVDAFAFAVVDGQSIARIYPKHVGNYLELRNQLMSAVSTNVQSVPFTSDRDIRFRQGAVRLDNHEIRIPWSIIPFFGSTVVRA